MLPFVEAALVRLEFAIQRLDAVDVSDFVHKDAAAALAKLRKIFETDKSRIVDQISSNFSSDRDRDALLAVCTHANFDVMDFLPIIGIVQRSVEIRNSFEFFEPLLVLARKLIGSDANLIFSSEWSYTPLARLYFEDLDNFVFIGLPASEASNALIIPLAGHEIGHSVWMHHKVETDLNPTLFSRVIELYKKNWSEFCRIFGEHDKNDLDGLLLSHIRDISIDWSKAQCEEIFCDALAVRIFGISYMHAFSYLLSPWNNIRAPEYPAMSKRVNYMLQAASCFDVDVPENYSTRFIEQKGKLSIENEYILGISDTVTDSLVDEIIRKADTICRNAGFCKPDAENISTLSRFFFNGVPLDGKQTLSSIINAGWSAYLNHDFWSKTSLNPLDRMQYTNELVLKSIEIMEYNERVGTSK